MYYRGAPNERFGGLLLPFLAGVAVTTPFVFLAKNNQPYYPQPYPVYYPYSIPTNESYPTYYPYPQFR